MSDTSNYRKPKHTIPPSIALAYPTAHTLKPGELEAWSERVTNDITSISERAAAVDLRLKCIENESTDFDTPSSVWYVLRGQDIVFAGAEVEAYDVIEAEIEEQTIRT